MVARAKRIPSAAWICALVALLNAFTWSLIVPLFQVPDEPAHIAYAQHMAESGAPPTGRNDRPPYSPEERRLLDVLRWKQVIHRPDNRPPATASAHKLIDRTLRRPAERLGEGGFTSVTNNPPLYYGIAAIAYRISPKTSLPDRIHAMRLISVLLAAATTLLIFLFCRELLPATPWAWTVGGMAVAFQPLFGFISGGVTSDSLLFTAAAAIFLGLARSFRAGLTFKRGLWIGIALAVLILAKINMLGLLPGIALGLLLLIRRAPAAHRHEAAAGALAAVGVALAATATYMLLNEVVWDRGLFFGASGASLGSAESIKGTALFDVPTGGLSGKIFYLWEFYLPRLPFMDPQFTGYPLYNVWFKGFIGAFGWLEYGFPNWVYGLALWLCIAVLGLAGRELFEFRAAVRSRLGELITYVTIMAGLVLLTNANGYAARTGGAVGFEQARYLLPLLALYAAIVALAVRGAGRRWGPPVGIVIVCIAIAHSAVAMLLTLTRYYG